jgi:hypothetical protein
VLLDESDLIFTVECKISFRPCCMYVLRMHKECDGR